MSYTITSYTRSKARALGVQVKLSKNKKKKLDVFKNGKKIASIGARGMGDFPTYKREKGLEFAKKRQKAYRSRMAKNINKVGTPGYYAGKLLW
jgi:hypothetical protein|tara:strand:- start:279 stop:557 length:279 start_codon:yes stop_codon:yes gene_type:complete